MSTAIQRRPSGSSPEPDSSHWQPIGHYLLHGFQGIMQVECDDEYHSHGGFQKAVSRLLSLKEDQSTKFVLMHWNLQKYSGEEIVAESEPLALDDETAETHIMNHYKTHVTVDNYTQERKPCFKADGCRWFVRLEDEMAPIWPEPRETDRIAILQNVDHTGSTFLPTMEDWWVERGIVWNIDQVREYTQTVLDLASGQDSTDCYYVIATPTHREGRQVKHEKHLWGYGIGGFAPLHMMPLSAPDGQDLLGHGERKSFVSFQTGTPDHPHMWFPGYHPPPISDSLAAETQLAHHVDLANSTNLASFIRWKAMMSFSETGDWDNIESLTILTKSQFQGTNPPEVAVLEKQTISMLYSSENQDVSMSDVNERDVDELVHSRSPIFIIRPNWKLDAGERLKEANYLGEEWMPAPSLLEKNTLREMWEWIREQCPPETANGREFYRIHPLQLNGPNTITDDDRGPNEYCSYYVGPHTTERDWFRIRATIPSPVVKVTPVYKHETLWIGRHDHPSVWGPRYGRVSKYKQTASSPRGSSAPVARHQQGMNTHAMPLTETLTLSLDAEILTQTQQQWVIDSWPQIRAVFSSKVRAAAEPIIQESVEVRTELETTEPEHDSAEAQIQREAEERQLSQPVVSPSSGRDETHKPSRVSSLAWSLGVPAFSTGGDRSEAQRRAQTPANPTASASGSETSDSESASETTTPTPTPPPPPPPPTLRPKRPAPSAVRSRSKSVAPVDGPPRPCVTHSTVLSKKAIMRRGRSPDSDKRDEVDMDFMNQVKRLVQSKDTGKPDPYHCSKCFRPMPTNSKDNMTVADIVDAHTDPNGLCQTRQAEGDTTNLPNRSGFIRQSKMKNFIQACKKGMMRWHPEYEGTLFPVARDVRVDIDLKSRLEVFELDPAIGDFRDKKRVASLDDDLKKLRAQFVSAKSRPQWKHDPNHPDNIRQFRERWGELPWPPPNPPTDEEVEYFNKHGELQHPRELPPRAAAVEAQTQTQTQTQTQVRAQTPFRPTARRTQTKAGKGKRQRTNKDKSPAPADRNAKRRKTVPQEQQTYHPSRRGQQREAEDEEEEEDAHTPSRADVIADARSINVGGANATEMQVDGSPAENTRSRSEPEAQEERILNADEEEAAAALIDLSMVD